MTGPREAEVNRAFVALASRLVDGFDVVDLLGELTEQCTSLLDIASAGLLLADQAGTLHVLAASSERTRLLEVFQLQRAQGPCRDCFLSGRPVSVADLEDMAERWPEFVPRARALGFASVHALPMRLHDRVLGTLGLFGAAIGALAPDDLALGQALADVASVALVQDMSVRDTGAYNGQLQAALSSRVVLEQAKGVLAQLGGIDVSDAYLLLRRYARSKGVMLSAVAQAVVSRQIDARAVLAETVVAD